MNEATKINALTEAQRDHALDAARRRIAGPEPQPDAFERTTFRKYPPDLLRLLRRIGYVVLAAAFLPSAVRIFIATRETTTYTVDGLAIVIAAASVLLAESGQIAFTLWSSATEERRLRLALLLGALGCTVFALVGNAHVVQPFAQSNAIPYLEAFLPPVLVLITSYVLKAQALHSVEVRFAAQEAYQTAHAHWQQAYETAHEHPRWLHAAANALRDALRTANKGSKKVLRDLTDEDWRALILRELAADQWYERAEQHAQVEAERTQQIERARTAQAKAAHSSGTGSGVRTGETDGAVRDNGDGTHTATCPYCAETFQRYTQKGATNALSAHVGRWCKVRNQPSADARTVSVNGASVEVSHES